MMGQLSSGQERLFYSFNLEDHIPANHLLRSIDRCLDLSDLRHHLADLYSPIGRPSIDPELMLRMLIVGYCYGIRSERRLCEEAHLNLAYRWRKLLIVRLSADDKIVLPHFNLMTMPRLYDDQEAGSPDEDFIGQKIIGWQKGNSQDAIDLAEFYSTRGQSQKALYWVRKARETGLAASCFKFGMDLLDSHPDRAVIYLIEAFQGGHSEAVNPLSKLLSDYSPAELGLDHNIHNETAELLQELRKQIAASELTTIFLPGTRPVLFQKDPGPATFDNAQWGGGSLFVVAWRGVKFAVTALHVIENLGADRKEFRLLIPGTETTLEMYGGISPSKKPPSERDEVDDIYAWHIKGVAHDEEDIGWWSWRLGRWSKPASELSDAQELFAAGYPDIEDRYDHENFKVIPIASILRGRLSTDKAVEGIYVMDVDEVDHSMNLMSGGPVFARLDGIMHYVGMILRGNSDVRKIYFVDVTYIIALLEKHNKGHHPGVVEIP